MIMEKKVYALVNEYQFMQEEKENGMYFLEK